MQIEIQGEEKVDFFCVSVYFSETFMFYSYSPKVVYRLLFL